MNLNLAYLAVMLSLGQVVDSGSTEEQLIDAEIMTVDASCNEGSPCVKSSCPGGYGEIIGCTETGKPICACVGCKYAPDGAACDDGNPLTYDDRCVTRQCTGTPTPFTAVFLDSTTKLKKNDPLPAGRTDATLRLAKNEFEAAQLAIKPNAGAPALTITASPITCNGTTGAKLSFSAHREEFIDVTTTSGIDGALGLWPDRLIPEYDEIGGRPYLDTRGLPTFPWTPDGGNLIAYVEAHAAPTCNAASYANWITVSWNEGTTPKSTKFKVSLIVESFALPSTSTLSSYYGMTPGFVCRAHGQSDPCPSLTTLYAQFMLDHRIAVDPVAAFPDAAFESKYGDLFDGLRRPSWAKLADAKPTTAGALQYPDIALAQQWADLYTRRGWMDRTFWYWCDEPQGGRYCPDGWTGIPDRATLAHSFNPKLRVLVTTSHEDANAALGPGYVNSIDTIVPNVIAIQPQGSTTFQAAVDELTQYTPYLQGGFQKLWLYQACDTAGCGSINPLRSAYPQFGIDVSGVKNRAMQWLTFEMATTTGASIGISGELYWDTVAAYGRAVGNEIRDRDLFMSGQYGDGTLVYPGNGRPLPSLRLKLLRDGMEDWEYLKLVAANDLACARSIARSLFEHARAVSNVDVTPQELLTHREMAAQKIRNPGAACPVPLK